MSSPAEFQLASPPSDGISSVTFAPAGSLNTDMLLASCWDSTLRLYNAATNTLLANFAHASAVLDSTFGPEGRVCYSGAVDGSLSSCDITTGAQSTLGGHAQGIRCVKFDPATGLVVTGSWDESVKLWDARTARCVSTHQQSAKVFAMACTSDSKLIVGTADRHILIWDLRKMESVLQRRESSLKFQTRCIQPFSNGHGYVLGSIEGRIAVEYIDPSPAVQQKKYAFKCHRVPINGVNTIYPVNSISFHPLYNTFASGGGDGIVSIWDGLNKRRICQLRPYPTSIASLAFNHDGSLLAIASSYTFEEGEKDMPNDAIFIRRITDADVQPK
ncbi:testis mitotic checkpoint BUB3 [Capsaspora owczarzaki ATCC 30864]|uniref:Testis mitotic checkpoint BUB3 n=1 Tax=Capsaspora owczarzaki (strain ATCC 30864) TaxID=595528 RepID=A0A0D2VM19_CAPO3|nr:testis mitotic checkpoint BUB3 [Capsaspora owczarzaki ATCC 30864]KJE91147.1 testis mitotic checkpoint BUB3 [Capsaspora owczarzaki ATCC 30864]|eukprot:XP_004349076.1 testis mitotic checkpoint BUB3 [Capsaspora owczarzaki ATCC 30864]